MYNRILRLNFVVFHPCVYQQPFSRMGYISAMIAEMKKIKLVQRVVLSDDPHGTERTVIVDHHLKNPSLKR